ncbi:MAG: hypothetical protein K2L77_09625 [Muribaculaceae bacterium]|nr:hypothetical protein [Muribaculaceae bacterium]
MSGVTTEAELQHKINALRSMTKCELPALWQRFFDTLTSRISKISPINVDNYEFFQVNDDHKELQRIICNDNRIRKIVRFIEGGAFMVRCSDCKTLRSLLGEYGYTLPEQSYRTHFHYF